MPTDTGGHLGKPHRKLPRRPPSGMTSIISESYIAT